MADQKKVGRPESKNVFYFPHYTKSNKVLDLIEHKHGSEGYKCYYRLLEMAADADYHKLSIATENEKIMFDLGMNCEQDVIDDVIDILIDSDKIDRESWENARIIWMEDFVETLKPVYVNRRKPLPDKDSISTCRNTEKIKQKKNNKKKEREENEDSLLSVKEYEELFPDKNVSKSLEKYLEYDKSPTHTKALNWLEDEKELKPLEFKKSPLGYYIAYCDECDNQEFPNDEWAIKKGSTCCKAKYRPERKKPDNSKVNSKVDTPF